MLRIFEGLDKNSQIEGKEPFNDIEEAFDIVIDAEDALELYDMTLKEASIRTLEIQGVM